MLISGCAFAFMSASVKAVGDLPVYEKVFARNFVSLIVAAIMLIQARRTTDAKIFGKRENQFLLWNRSLWGVVGVYLIFGAISAGLPLTDANILSRLSPAFVTIFACCFLKEKILSLHVPLLITIFICATLIVKPTFDVRVLPALAAVAAAICSGITYTIVRYLKGREEPATIVFHFSLISVLAMLIPMISDFVIPTPIQILWLTAIGVFASVGQFGLTYAYKYSKASEVSIYSYSIVLCSFVLDIFAFGKMPDIWSIVGGIGIVVSAIILFIQNRKIDKA